MRFSHEHLYILPLLPCMLALPQEETLAEKHRLARRRITLVKATRSIVKS